MPGFCGKHCLQEPVPLFLSPVFIGYILKEMNNEFYMLTNKCTINSRPRNGNTER